MFVTFMNNTGPAEAISLGQAKYKEKVMACKACREILYFNDIHDDDIISSTCEHAHAYCACVEPALQSIVDHGSLVGFVISA